MRFSGGSLSHLLSLWRFFFHFWGNVSQQIGSPPPPPKKMSSMPLGKGQLRAQASERETVKNKPSFDRIVGRFG